MINDNNMIILIGFFILIQVTTLYILIKYRKSIDKKNIELMQFYLDTKFLQRMFVNNIQNSNTLEFCQEFISKIKDYYNLEEIIIIDSLKQFDFRENTIMNNSVIKFLQENIDKFSQQLNGYNLIRENINIYNTQYVLYLSKLTRTDKEDGLIVCIEHLSPLLSKHKKNALENCVHLLKTRLTYK